jgi:hypothetical protein
MNLIDTWWVSLGGGLARRKAFTYIRQQKQKKRRQAPTPRVGFEHTILALKRANIFRTLDGAAAMIGLS